MAAPEPYRFEPERVRDVADDESSEDSILGDPGAASRDDGIFMGESLQQERESSCCKLSPMKIPSSRLAAPGSPRM